MKPKKLIKGLTLNKTTVVHLKTDHQDKIKGGYSTVPTCGIVSCELTFCNGCTTPMPCYHP